jgi:hypothetical protein
MSEDARSPEQYAADIDAARERLVAFAGDCTGEQWKATPIAGDPRPVGVIVDHVAHAYEYLAAWIRQVLDGQQVSVTSDVVDALNATHAPAAASVTSAGAIDHLRRSGAALSALVSGCTAADLQADDGRVERFIQVAVRHADSHRTELAEALAR